MVTNIFFRVEFCSAGQSSPSQIHSPKSITSPTNGNKLENHRSKLVSANNVQKCNNCVKNNQNERPGLLQTPVSPSKSGQALQHSPKSTNLAPNAQNNQHKSEQRRPNTLNICNNQCSAQCGNTLSVSRPGSRHKLRHQNSSQGSYDSASPCLSRGTFFKEYVNNMSKAFLLDSSADHFSYYKFCIYLQTVARNCIQTAQG